MVATKFDNKFERWLIYQNSMLKNFSKIFEKGVDKDFKVWYYKCVPHGTNANWQINILKCTRFFKLNLNDSC